MQIVLTIPGLPPAKNEAKSLLGQGHSHLNRVTALLTEARRALEANGCQRFGSDLVGMSVRIFAPSGELPGDATNYLGGIGDVLEAKSRRGSLPHLGDLELVSLFDNDKQIREVHFYVTHAVDFAYEVKFWTLPEDVTHE